MCVYNLILTVTLKDRNYHLLFSPGKKLRHRNFKLVNDTQLKQVYITLKPSFSTLEPSFSFIPSLSLLPTLLFSHSAVFSDHQSPWGTYIL